MDPEQIYQEVLQEEQQKGSASPVAEGRAKAARARAEHGSPHPKEPKWWPGSQPQFEGGGEAPATEEDAVEEPAAEAAPAEEEPAEPAAPPAEEAQPEQPAVTAAQADADATAQTVAPPPDPGIEAPAAAAATAPAAAAPATVTQLAPDARPAGVRSGTTTGTRLRPEDEVTTEAQFEGQTAMFERRKLIDELVASGVPAAAVRHEDRGGSPLLALLYLLIPIVALVIVANLDIAGGAEGGEEGGGEGGGGGGGVTVTAASVQFDTDLIELPADEEATVTFNNEDSADHNIAIYAEEGGEEMFKGQVIGGGASTDYNVGPFEAGSYYFQCDLHPSMNGDVEVA